MSGRTYYHVLGVSREATQEEITNAKNALAKIYHPDANMHNDIDTTKEMQEILEAYRVLSNPEKRKAYDRKLGGGKGRVFRTFTVEETEETEESLSFVSCWNAALKLQETVKRSSWLLERESKRKNLSARILEKFGKRKNAGFIRVIFLSSFEEITYLSYCIRNNPLKEKELCAET